MRLTAALFVASLSDLEQRRRGLVRDWLPLYVVLAVYALLRGYASHVLWGRFSTDHKWPSTRSSAVDNHRRSRSNGGSSAPTTFGRWDYLAWLTYMSHFFTKFHRRRRALERDHAALQALRRAVSSGLTFLGYITYVLYPRCPPWLASQTGHIAPITRIVPVVWDHVGIHGAEALFTGNNQFDNNIAAMPSLHAAYPMLLLLFFWKRARPAVRAILVAYVLAMAFTLVYTGEHFVLDEVCRLGAMRSSRSSSGAVSSIAGLRGERAGREE